jgi:chromatin assembly factor 1 subunit B
MAPVEFGRTEETIQWGHPRQLRGHIGDIIDLTWSNDGQFLVSGSLDGTSILWSIQQNKYNKVQTLEGHRKFVQGVTIDPFFKFIASQSSDSTVRVYKNRKLKNQVQFFHKFTLRSREEQVAVTQNASIDNKTVTDNSEEPQGDIDMKDEGHSPGAAGATDQGEKLV